MFHTVYSPLGVQSIHPGGIMDPPPPDPASRRTGIQHTTRTNGFGLAHPDNLQYATLKIDSLSIGNSESSASSMETCSTATTPLTASVSNGKSRMSAPPLEGALARQRLCQVQRRRRLGGGNPPSTVGWGVPRSLPREGAHHGGARARLRARVYRRGAGGR